MSDENLSIIVDGIQTVGVHNGVARVKFIRLGADGKPVPAVELLIPVAQLNAIVQGLGKIAGGASGQPASRPAG
ncbi:MAG: hypothetical protein A3G81_16865 [Betaproteobacteria bacterium RIFCSPLOWO2_12_FULL_65_14]|nr:MAG: hypothetical protein A3G81_16865 [Betaproteobacteria bacterium RIFCSPLOWO2_12_FULL_65_14]